MINLLPPETKQAYRYGLANVILVRWLLAAFVGLIGVGLIGTYGWMNLHRSTVNYEGQVAALQASLKQQHQVTVDKQVQDISNSFQLVVKVLSKEVLFSKVLTSMAQTMPTGTYLTGLSIGNVQGALDVSAAATSYQAATQVQVNLADPRNQLFAKADIVNIAYHKDSQDKSHPYTVNIRALFAQNNPFLFINQQKVTAK